MGATPDTKVEPNPDAEPSIGDVAVDTRGGARLYVLKTHQHTAGEIFCNGVCLAHDADVDEDAAVVWVATAADLRGVDRTIDTHADVVAAVEDGLVLAVAYPTTLVAPLEGGSEAAEVSD